MDRYFAGEGLKNTPINTLFDLLLTLQSCINQQAWLKKEYIPQIED